MKSDVWGNSEGRRHFSGGSYARAITDDNENVLRLLRQEMRDAAELEDSGNPHYRAVAPDRAGAKPFSSRALAAHAAFVTALSGHLPRAIPLNADALDLEDRADHLATVLKALSVYLTVILDDTAQNVPGSLDLRDAEGLLADLTSDLTGAIQRAADDVAGRPA
jgi:hypothetical protein